MRKIYLLAILLTSLSLKAQDLAVKINPVSLFYNGAELSFESRTGKNTRISTEFTAAYIDYKINENKLSAFGAEIKFKFLLDKKDDNIEGTYIAPIGSLISGKFNDHDLDVYGVGAVGGYQFIFQNKNQNGFLIDLLGGFIYNLAPAYQLNTDSISGFKPRIGISLGYAF